MKLCTVEERINIEIGAWVKNSIKVIEKRGTDLKDETHRKCEEKRKILQQQLNDDKDLLKKIEDCISWPRQTLKHNNAASFLMIQPTITRRLQGLLEETLHDVPYENSRINIRDLNVGDSAIRSSSYWKHFI